MNQSIQLKLKKLPQALAELTHSNQFLKLSAFFAYGLCFLLAGVVYVLASAPPQVLTLTPDGALYERIAEPSRESAIRRVVGEYLELRYRWEPKTVASRIKESQVFILPATRKSFEISTAGVARFSQEKNVSQRVLPDTMQINFERQTVFIQGDRMTSIQGLRAAGALKLELSFDYGPRTARNPWGIYITKEREE